MWGRTGGRRTGGPSAPGPKAKPQIDDQPCPDTVNLAGAVAPCCATIVSVSERYRVTLRNRGVTIDVGADEPIFDACDAAGLDLPIACKYGGCITCAAKLIEGKVRQPGATAINKRQNAEGYILLCVARPKSDCVIDVGVESHDKLYANPFAKAENLDVLLKAQGKLP